MLLQCTFDTTLCNDLSCQYRFNDVQIIIQFATFALINIIVMFSDILFDVYFKNLFPFTDKFIRIHNLLLILFRTMESSILILAWIHACIFATLFYLWTNYYFQLIQLWPKSFQDFCVFGRICAWVCACHFLLSFMEKKICFNRLLVCRYADPVNKY